MDWIATVSQIGGIGGVLAVIIFLMYRTQDKQMREDRKYMEDRLNGIINSYNSVISDNNKVLSELITWLKAKNGGGK